MATTLIKNVQLVNRDTTRTVDILLKDGRFARIDGTIDAPGATEIDGTGKIAMPGVIDDQVHFREPGITYKAEIATESRAAVAGGVTSFMEMPNVKPATLTQELLQKKYDRAAAVSPANYSFFMGASNDNLEEVLQTDPTQVCGVKAFMGSSTGNMLVDDPVTLDHLFRECKTLIATHCEDEETIRANAAIYKERHGEHVPIECHPDIRNVAGCLRSSNLAVELAKRHNTRLHILHISTAEELALFGNDRPLREKRITAEVCVHHLHFDRDDYYTQGTQIKCNPAIKEKRHREALLPALLDDRLDIIATDHAPHTWDEKRQSYFRAPSGLPLVQHSLPLMLEFVRDGKLTLEDMVRKMCHAPADCFRLLERGYVDEGYFADLVLVDPNAPWTVSKENIRSKCGWSPFLGKTFAGRVTDTFVNGNHVYSQGKLREGTRGERLRFEAER